MSSNPTPALVKEFLDAFEEVFGKDWNNTKQMLGIHPETEAQKINSAKMGLESIPIIAEDGTFIEPKIDDENEDWGNRARLLKAYRALKENP